MKKGNKILCYLIYLYVLLLPLLPSKFKIFKLPFNGDMLLALIIFLYFFLILFFSDYRVRFINGIKDLFKDYLGISIIVLVGIMFISTFYAFDKRTALNESVRFLTYIILYFIIKYQITERKVLDNILKIYIMTCLIVSFVGIIQSFAGIGMIQKSKLAIFTRISSTLENSNNLGAFLIFPLFPLILLTIEEKIKKKKIFYGLCSILFIANMILTYSRNALIGLAIGFVIVILIYGFKYIYFGFLIIILGAFVPKIRDRFIEIGSLNQDLSRIKIWGIAYYMIKAHPLFGVGNGNYASLYEVYGNRFPKYSFKTVELHPHNILLKFQSELGIIGTASFISFVIIFIIKLKKFVLTTENFFYKTFYKGFFISFVVFLVMNMVDNFFSAPKVIAYMWILLAIFECISYNEKMFD